MPQTIPPNAFGLIQLGEKFGLKRGVDAAFTEWSEALPELSHSEDLAIEEIKQEYLHLSQYDLLEPAVKLIVLSPLLRLAGFYRVRYRSIAAMICKLWLGAYVA
jgi:hypothetical protein